MHPHNRVQDNILFCRDPDDGTILEEGSGDGADDGADPQPAELGLILSHLHV